MAWLQRLASVLAHRRFPWLAAALGLVLASGVLGQGLQLDDHLHRLYVQASARGAAPGWWWDLYAVATGDVDATRAAMEQGASPWWTLPELRVRFLRPLSAVTHHLDHRLWPDAVGLMHAQSLLWFGGLVVAVGAMLRRWLGPSWIAGLATLVFAIDDAHATPIAWIAQRSALVTALLTVLALVAHDRARREGWRAGAWLGPLAFAAALAAGESAVAGLGYLLAHAGLLDPAAQREPGRSLARRTAAVASAVAPYLAITLAWRLLYDGLGYGAYGSSVYLDPVRESPAFLGALPGRVGALALGQLTPVAAQTWATSTAAWTSASWAWVLSSIVWIVALVPRLRWDRGLAACLGGAALALVPTATAIPHDRLLLMVGVGASAAVPGIVAVVVTLAGPRGDRARRGPIAATGRAALAMFAGAVGLVHTVGAGYALPAEIADVPLRLEHEQHEGAGGIPADAALARQELVIVNSPPTFVAATLWLERQGGEVPLPRRLRLLGSTFAPVIVQRPDAHTLVLEPLGGYLGDPFTTIVRGPGHPFARGDRIALDGWSVEILGLAHDRPTVVRIHFDDRLDDPGLRWITWRGDRFVPFVLPPIGGRTVSPGRAPDPPRP